MGTAFLRLHPENLLDTPLPAPSEATQRAIADYLDAETARIDGTVMARRRMLALAHERLDGEVTKILDRPEWPVVALKWRTEVTVGIVIRPSELYADTGFPCLRGLNVRPGVVTDEDLVLISPEGNAANAKSILGDGDVVVVRTGNAGAAAVVPPWAVGGNCVDLLLVRRTDALEPRFLEAVLNSAVVRRQVEEGSVGALQAHFNTESLGNIRVPVPPIAEQLRVVDAIDSLRDRAEQLASALARQIDLLLERREALITTAITGELEMAGVSA
jgi:type I restriction enzyme S subunit